MKVSAKFQVLVTYLLYSSTEVSGHGYLKSPRSRNWYAKEQGKWSGGGATDPQIETCPHCLNRNSNTCGKTGGDDYDYPLNALGGPMPKTIQAIYDQGRDIILESVLTAHHKGHFTYKACPIEGDELPTQACFDSNPLTFVEDTLYGAPPDPNYPDRAYIPLAGHPRYQKTSAGYFHSHKYRLPSNLVGEYVLIQWHYITANSCLPEGYNNYQFPPNFNPGSLRTCSYPLPADGNGAPEQFWNCAEIKIRSSGPISPPTPVITPAPFAPPTSAPVTPPTFAPVTPPTSAPLAPPTSAPVVAPTMTPVIPPTEAPVASPVQNPPEEFNCPTVTSEPTAVGLPDCTGFYYCIDGEKFTQVLYCPTGLLFNEDIGNCDFPYNVNC